MTTETAPSFAPSEIAETDTGYMIVWEHPRLTLHLDDIETRGTYNVAAWVTCEGGGLKVPMGRFSLSNPKTLAEALPIAVDNPALATDLCRWGLDALRTYLNNKTGSYRKFIEFAPEGPSPFLLEPYIRQNQHTLIFGDGDNGKSLLALWWGLQVASNHGPVLYLDYETDANTTAERLFWLLDGAGLPMPDNFAYLEGIEPLARCLPVVKQHVHELKPVLIIVDSASMASGKPQEDEAVLSYFAAFRSLGAAGLTITHVSKNGRETEPYGSVYWRNMSRLALRIDGEREEDGILVSFTDTKSNNNSKVPPRALRFKWNEAGDEVRVTADNPLQVEAVANRRALKDLLGDALNQPKTVAELCRELEKGDSNIRGQLNKYPRLFVHLPDGRWANVHRQLDC